ncbi:MAG TPA: hypothetical protein VMY34_11255 [Acidimicrobiales bacterium]|nr:hypothetical protein [Acidimicrobiales bacterium]
MHNGFGNALTRAFELAVIPPLFGGAGYLVDGWLGTTPVIMGILGLIGLLGVAVKMFYGYDRDMKAESAGAPWGPARADTTISGPAR